MQKLTDSALIFAGNDNVATALREIPAGKYQLPDGSRLDVPEPIQPGFKLAIRDIPAGSEIYKYGYAIGTASVDVPAGSGVHVHNLTSRVKSSTGGDA
ncbi:MAG: UxaA family hydrolase [Phycisphaerae bacterium]